MRKAAEVLQMKDDRGMNPRYGQGYGKEAPQRDKCEEEHIIGTGRERCVRTETETHTTESETQGQRVLYAYSKSLCLSLSHAEKQR